MGISVSPGDGLDPKPTNTVCNCKLSLEVLAQGKSKIHVVVAWYKVASKNTGNFRARLYRTCKHFRWFQQYYHLITPTVARLKENNSDWSSTPISVLMHALFRAQDLLSLQMGNLLKYMLNFHILRFLFYSSIVFYV